MSLAIVCQVSLFFSLVSSIALKLERNTSEEALGVLLLITMLTPPVLGFLYQCGVDIEEGFGAAKVRSAAFRVFQRTVGACIDKFIAPADDEPADSVQPVAEKGPEVVTVSSVVTRSEPYTVLAASHSAADHAI